MINTILLLGALISQPNSPAVPFCFGCIRDQATGLGAKASVTINITLNVVPSHLASIDIQKVDPNIEGVYRVAVTERITGGSDAFNTVKDILVLDDFMILGGKERLEFAFNGDGSIGIEAPKIVALYEYPSNKTPEEVVAMVKSRHNLLAIYTLTSKEKGE